MDKNPKEDFMSKIVSVILILVLFFSTAINGFAEEDVDPGWIVLGVIIVIGIVYAVITASDAHNSEADAPDDGIGMVSTEDETHNTKTGGNTILNFLQHVEAGFTTNNDIYVGLRFQF